jgi:hypothetical protein
MTDASNPTSTPLPRVKSSGENRDSAHLIETEQLLAAYSALLTAEQALERSRAVVAREARLFRTMMGLK